MSVPVALPIISRNVPAYTNDDFFGAFPASQGNDATYGNYWRCVTEAAASNTGPLTQAVYLAYDLSGVASAHRKSCVVVWYNDNMTGAYNPTLISNNYYNVARDYTVDANAAAGGTQPTSGWVTLATVTGNLYHSRQHAVDLTGYNWVRIRVTSINGVVANDNVALNMDVHDASLGNQDNWIAYGDSITQRGFDHSDSILPKLINTSNASYWPIIENGGIGGFLSADGATNISTWLPLFSGKYVCLNYGTNDANNAAPGDPNVANTFYTNMQTMVAAVLSAGKIPIIPKIPWGGTASLIANAPLINAKIAALYTAYPAIVPGPDLYSYFTANQSLIGGDGIHPTDPDGYTAYRNQWATWAIATIYTAPSGGGGTSPMTYTNSQFEEAIVALANLIDGSGNFVVKVSNADSNGQATMANSAPVVIASDQSNVPGNLKQINGQTPTLDNTTILAMSVRGKGAGTAGDTALLLDALGQMTIEDFIRYQILQGNGFAATTGLIATATNSNAMVGLQILGANASKNILIYRMFATPGGNLESDVRLNQGTANTPDTNLTASPNVVNQSGAATSSVATVKGAPASVTTTTTVGTQRAQYSVGANTVVELLQQGSTIYIPKNTNGYGVGYVKVATAANSAAMSAEWIEF